MSIFAPRVNFKPFEYPEASSYKEAIQHSYWLVSEWNFLSDVQQFHTVLTPSEREVVRRTLLAISQVEVAVKRFWAQIDSRFPKPEIAQVGIVLAECEVRHADAYSHLLEVLGLNEEFSSLLDEPLISGRMNYLTKYMKSDINNEEYALTLALFTSFIENVSLFSQFLIMKSFSFKRNLLKDIDNVIQATIREALLHGLFGVWLINKMKEEHPEWFNDAFYDRLRKAAEKAFLAESKIVDWICEQGELEFLSADVIKEFVASRINESIVSMGGSEVFVIDSEKIKNIEWFNNELYGATSTDFFNKRPSTYSKRTQAFTAEGLF